MNERSRHTKACRLFSCSLRPRPSSIIQNHDTVKQDDTLSFIPMLPDADRTLHDPNPNPYRSPSARNASSSVTRTPLKPRSAAASAAAAVVAMTLLHVLVYSLGYSAREPIFFLFALLYLGWPFILLRLPKTHVIAAAIFPVFWIWLGLRYTSDIGPDSYMFSAMPPCAAGLWGVCLSGIFAGYRLICT